MADRAETNWEILAGLRFVLAVIVICGHVAFYFADTDAVTTWLGELGGKTAVVGFLIVSGYSIAASLEFRRSGFYRRRLLRIYPLYLFAILFAFGTELACGGIAHMPSGRDIVGTGAIVALGNAVFGQTFVVKPIAFDGPVWSLAVEVSYYVAAPLLLWLDRRVVMGLLLVSALAYIAPRRDDLGAVYYLVSRFNALAYAWAWLMGFVLHGSRRGWIVPVFAVGGAGLIALNPYSNPEAAAPATFLAVFGCILAARWTPRTALPRWLRVTLTYLGDLSYPLYLIHFPALIVAVAIGLRSAWPAMAFAMVLSMAALSLIDVRLKRWGLAVLRGRTARQDASQAAPGD